MLSSSSLRPQVLQRPAQTALRGWLRGGGTYAKTAEGPEELSRGLHSTGYKVRDRPTPPPSRPLVPVHLLPDRYH